MEGVNLSHIDQTLEQKLFLQLRAATTDAYLKETPAASHIIDAYDRFMEDIPKLVEKVGSYCIVGHDGDKKPIITAWHMEYVGILGIDMHFHDLGESQKKVLCCRSTKGCDQQCRTEGHAFEIWTPSQTRAMDGKSYLIPIFVNIVRVVYRTKRMVTKTDQEGNQVCVSITDDELEELEKLLFRSTRKSGDKRGRYLYTQIQSCENPLFHFLEKSEEYSGLQSQSVIYVPRMVGSKTCILSKRMRNGVVDEKLRVIQKPYKLSDYARLGEDPDDTGGYLLIQGGEYVVRLTNRGATNQFITTTSKHNGVQNYKTLIRIHTDDMDPLDVETCYIISGFSKEDSSLSVPLKNIEKLKKRGISKKMLKEIDTRYKLLWFGASWLYKTIPVSVLFYALGAFKDTDVYGLMGAEYCLHLDDKEETYRCVCDTVDMGKYFCLKEVEMQSDLGDREKLVQGARSLLAKVFRINRYEKKMIQTFEGRQSFFETRIINYIMRNVRVRNPLSQMSRSVKAATVSHMCIRTVRCMAEVAPLDDVDHLGNQRIYGVYEFMSHLFLTTVRHNMSMITDLCFRHFNKNSWNFRNKTILSYPENGWNFNAALNRFLYCIKTGTIKYNDFSFTGITSRINRTSRYAAQASVQNISSTIDKKSKTIKPRQVHSTQFGVICPVDTSEGEKCGLNKHKALASRVSNDLSRELFRDLNRLIFQEKTEQKVFVPSPTDDENVLFQSLVDNIYKRFYPIVMNGICLGFTANATSLCARINTWREESMERTDVSAVVLPRRQILEIRTLFGRLMRPLFNVRASKDDSRDFIIPASRAILTALNGSIRERKMITLEKLFASHTITFADVLQQENMLIGMDPTQLADQPRDFLQKKPVTHFEIDPTLIFGLRGSLLPFVTHNPTPRCTYYIQMKSAAVGVPMLNHLDTNESTVYSLCYPQRSLTMMRTSVEAGMYDNPDCQQAFVLIGIFTGYNQEDGVIINQSSVDRGFGRVIVTKKFVLKEKRTGLDESPLGQKVGDVVLANPRPFCSKLRPSSVWGEMDDFGLLQVGMRINRGDPIIGAYKVVPVEEEGQMENGRRGVRIVNSRVSCSLFYKGDSAGTIDSIKVDTDSNGLKRAVVHVSFTRNLTVGDKTSQPNQKNTVGMLYRQEDMPFAGGPEGIRGMTPDGILNTHCIPSRSTISTVIQPIYNYINLALGKACNGSAFRPQETDPKQKDSVFAKAKQLGFTPFCTVPFFNPFTGQYFRDESGWPTQFTFGMMDFHRLKHMVADKIQSASRATRDRLTHQPVQGKERGGAVRMGEMERDALIAHGVSFTLDDAFMKRSDEEVVQICDNCHSLAFSANKRQDYRGHGICARTGCYGKGTSSIRMPYAAKLLFQELNSMGVSVQVTCAEEGLEVTRETSDAPFDFSALLQSLKAC